MFDFDLCTETNFLFNKAKFQNVKLVQQTHNF